MAIFDIDLQKSQALRFVNLEREKLPQNYDDRLIKNLVYANTANRDITQVFEQTDYLNIHFRTDYSVYTIIIIDDLGIELDITSNQSLSFTDPLGLKYYNLPISLSSLTKCYFVEIRLNEQNKPINIFKSENFKVSEIVPNSTWIECYGNERTYDDSQHWANDIRQGIRVISRLRDYEFSQSKNVYDSVDYVPETLKSKPNRTVMLDVDLDNQYILEKINLFLNHDFFWVNGVRYNNDEAVSNTPMGNLLAYKSQIQLIESDYQNGESRELTGEFPPVPPPELSALLAISDTLTLAINNTNSLAID
jgi:hypothetical protein